MGVSARSVDEVKHRQGTGMSRAGRVRQSVK